MSGDKDYEPTLVDYENQGRKLAVCFYQPVGWGASIDLLSVNGAEFIDSRTRNNHGQLDDSDCCTIDANICPKCSKRLASGLAEFVLTTSVRENS